MVHALLVPDQDYRWGEGGKGPRERFLKKAGGKPGKERRKAGSHGQFHWPLELLLCRISKAVCHQEPEIRTRLNGVSDRGIPELLDGVGELWDKNSLDNRACQQQDPESDFPPLLYVLSGFELQGSLCHLVSSCTRGRSGRALHPTLNAGIVASAGAGHQAGQ